MLEFNQLDSINFQGVVVVFGRAATGGDRGIYFNVLGLDVDADDDSLDWTGFTRLEFTQQVRQVGMSIITVATDESTMQPTDDPFRVVTDQKYISIIQQSVRGTLYVNRFTLKKTKAGTDQKRTEYALEPAWEVRFARSRNEDVPADSSDSQEYLDPDGEPFLEPSLELSMVDAVKDGAFDVVLLPVSGSEKFAWQFLTLDAAGTGVNLFNFPSNADGLFDVADKTIGEDYRIAPDSSFSVMKQGGTSALPIQAAPRAAIYIKHEKVVQPDGSSIGVKRATRAMLVLPVKDGSVIATATIDSAVGTAGTLAELSGGIETSDIVPAAFDLCFDGLSYLQLNAPGTGSNPLEIKGPYKMEFMVAPAALGHNVTIIGGADTADPKTLPPYAKIVDGDRLEIGFGNGSETVSCSTLHQVLLSGVWSKVEIDYAGAGQDPFTIRINDTVVPLTSCATSAEPSGTAVARIGGAEAGFQGALNTVSIDVGGTNVVTLPCDTVDYAASPPTTPNTAGSGVTVTVFGPKPEPSSSPVNVNMSGSFYIDDMGLTYYAGLASFIQPESSCCLIDGSDGLLHLYYQGADNLFTVSQFSTGAARATFYAGWTTDWSQADAPPEGLRNVVVHMRRPTSEWSHIGPNLMASADNTQSGFLNFVAHRVGTYMNPTDITVTPSAVSPLLCDVTVTATADVGKETWTGLPRDINQMSRIWNGAASNNPDSQDVLDRSQPYFDYSAAVPAVIAPASAGNSYFLFTSVPFLDLNLASVTVEAGTAAGFVNITIEIEAPPTWPDSDLLVQSWPNVPEAPLSLTNVFAGRTQAYDYSTVTTPGTQAYGLPASTSRSDQQTNYVVIFVQDALTAFAVTVSNGSSAALCDVEICGKSLANVPRDQNTFVEVINGTAAHYAYPADYKTDVADKLYAITDGLTAAVENVTQLNTPSGGLAYAGLLRVLFSSTEYDAGVLSPIAKTTAGIIQGASFAFKGSSQPITASMLFGAVIVSPPTDGGVGRLEDTSGYSDGKAPVVALGINGGWTPQTPEFCLSMNAGKSTNYVSFDVDKTYTPSDKLAILGDMTLAAWLYNDTASNEISRALTYNVTGNIAHPDAPIQYMIGSKLGAALNFAADTFVQSSFNFDPPNTTVQIYVKPPNGGTAGTVWTLSEVRGGTTFLSLALNQFGKAVLNFMGNAGSVETVNPLPTGQFSCLTATVADAGGGKVTLSLCVNAGAPVTTEATNSFSGALGALMLGSNLNAGAAMTANGAAFWQRALTAEEVSNSYTYGFPDTDQLLGIRWNLAEGTGTVIQNSAATGAEFDAEVINPAQTPWDQAGAFNVPYVGRNDYVISSNRILKGWTNVALASRQGHALNLNGSNWGMVEDGEPFNPGTSFSIEAWIAPNSQNSKQIIVEKPGSYVLYVNTLGQVCLTVSVSQEGEFYDDPPEIFSYPLKAAISPGETTYVVANFTTGTVDDKQGSDQYVEQKYFIKASFWINGKKQPPADKLDYTKTVSVANEKSSFYLGAASDETFGFDGLISQVRIWGRTLNEAEIAKVYALHFPPDDLDGLVAGWDFDDQKGTIAKGMGDKNDLQLTSNQLWAIWQDVARAEIYVNGYASIPIRLQPGDVGGYQDTQFTLGGAMKSAALSSKYAGRIDDVRLYSSLQTTQQVRESISKSLTGAEDNLAAYWRIDAGSGSTVYDMTGRGNNGTLMPASAPPGWSSDAAPIQNEAQYVVKAPGGVADYYVAAITGQPSVVEYAAAEQDAYGKIFSVLKRGYFYYTVQGVTALQVGYKVGDLDTVFVGQVQSKPAIVGYIEGGPPLPSENQTLAYWYGDNGGPASAYARSTSVTYQESETKTWSFNATQSSVFKGEFNFKGGYYQKSKSQVEVGLGAEAATQVQESEIKAGGKIKLGGDIGEAQSVQQSHANGSSLTSALSPAGMWEPADHILNPTVGRRYIQNNVGIAIVKSATADLYMLAIKGTQIPVSYVLVPNLTIPVDTNIIDFPINPKYVKNGTLDGKVGLVNDPDYPQANEERGSYFKPVEAYAIKQKIEKEEQQIKAFYDQFSQNRYRVISSLGAVKDKLGENAAYDFSRKLNQRSIYNNYVWSAVGGMHREEHTIANSYTETFAGNSSLTFAAGFEFSGKFGTPVAGFYIETDALLGNTWSMTATKSEAVSNGFNLSCVVSPTDFLPAPVIETGIGGKLEFKGYGDKPAPGKVDGYRFMAFLLAPSEANYTALSQVIDQNWLNNSTSAAAAAMREATAAENGPWRILYRTTYVSRVPAPFQPVKDDTSAPNITPPANLASNSWMVRIIDDLLPQAEPTPLQIGGAIDKVLGSKNTGDGILKDLIPWWANFYARAQEYGTDEFKELADLRANLLGYMVSKYEAQRYMEIDSALL